MLNSPSPLLIEPHRLQALLGDARGRFDLISLPECESTNTLLLERAVQGAPSGSVLVVNRQTSGRGSRGRTWLASPESSLTFSVLWRFDGGMERLTGLSLAAGLAVVRALEVCGAEGVMLKWPNDILYNNAKLGGILVELHKEADRTVAVIGLGLNLSLPASIEGLGGLSLPPVALDSIFSSLPERHILLAQLLIEFAHVLDCFSSGGFAVLRDQWQVRNVWQDKPVRLLREGRIEKEGVCRGADADGALLVQTANGIERCLSGDLSLRAP